MHAEVDPLLVVRIARHDHLHHLTGAICDKPIPRRLYNISQRHDRKGCGCHQPDEFPQHGSVGQQLPRDPGDGQR